jgi:hypothetical protein
MAVMARDSWTDARLDDLNTKVDHGFAAVDKRFEAVDKRFDKVDKRFERVEDDIKEFRAEVNRRFDAQHQLLHSQNRLLTVSMIGLFSCMFTGFAGLIAVQIWV